MVREEHNRISLGLIMATTLLLLTGTLLYFYHLGKTDFAIEAPARIAVYARQMNLHDTWLAPIYGEQRRVDIPPLYLWAVKLASGFSSEVGPFETRLPGALSALLLVLLSSWWFYRHVTRYGREDMVDAPAEGFALLAGLMLASNPILFTLGREGTLHAMFTLIYIGAAFCWSESLEARRSFYAGQSWRTWILWGYVLAGAAMLVKGPLVLLLLLIPYALAARSYRLRRLDWIHGVGLLLALAIGASWPLAVGLRHPDVAGEAWRNWLTFQLGSKVDSSLSLGDYFRHLVDYPVRILADSFPWVILALIMAVRVWLKKDRSPTLVFWMCSLLGNLVVMALVSSLVGQHLLPTIVFVVLLASDGIYRWNFENSWSVAWRTLLRIMLVLATFVGIFCAVLLNSDLGLVLFILLPIIWVIWAIYARTHGLEFTPWETNIRVVAMVVVLLIMSEAILLSDWEPRKRFLKDRLAYFHRIEKRLPDKDPACFLYSRDMGVLYDYYLGSMPVLTKGLASLPPSKPGQPTFLFAGRDLRTLMQNRKLAPVTFYWNEAANKPQQGMFEVLTDEQMTTAPLQERLQVVLLGNSGTGSRDQRRVAQRLNKTMRQRPIDDVLLLGNNLYGPSLFKHLGFLKRFERPYDRLLNRGVVFHALLGHEDQSAAWAQLHYPPFHMNGQRYYVHTLDGGMVDCFMLDSETLHRDKKFDEEQLAWLEQALAKSQAPWKVVGLHEALVSAAAQGNTNDALAARLLPLFDRYRVNLVAWSGGDWYERLALPGHYPVFLNAGWSGDKDEARFKADPRLIKGYDERAGFVRIGFAPARATVQALNDRGEVIDQVQLTTPSVAAPSAQAPAPSPAPAPPAAQPTVTPTPAATPAAR